MDWRLPFGIGGGLVAVLSIALCLGACAGSSGGGSKPVAVPSITAEPANQTVTVGQTATFAVVAGGAAPLSFQWQKDGSSVPGATAASYTTPPTATTDNGSTFDVIVSNSAGNVTSSAATLNVTGVAPTITTQPANQTVTAGQTATFSVVATGTAPLSYQWQKNGSAISGANAASYTTPPTATTDNGSTFDVIVSNSAGPVTSNAASLTVNPAASDIDFVNGFTPSGLTLNGSAAITTAKLRLTDGGAGEAGSAFFNTPAIVQSFITDFTFQLTNPNADGFTFTIQGNSATALGAGGESVGYGNTSSGTGGIGNSVAVGFQLYSSVLGNIEVSRVGMWTDGASPGATPGIDTTLSGVNLRSGDVMSGHIAYDGTMLTLIVTDTTTKASFGTRFSVDIPGIVGGTSAYIGFTGGTGSLTATQDILTWKYTAVPVSPFAWPVDTPITYAASACGPPNDFSTYCSEIPIFGQYHTGIDVCPQTPGCAIGNPVYATSSGVVELALVVNSSAFLCDGSPATGYPINPSTSNLGNVIVIAHPNGEFSLYGHLDCIWPGIAAEQQVATGTRIGNQGHSADGDQDRTFTPHTHFEMKDRAVTGDPTNKGYSGYTSDVPDGYGYHDARIYISPFSPTSIPPTAIKVVASTAQSIRTGPDTSFAAMASVAPSQEFVASATDGAWYQIDLPNVSGPVSGWVQGSSGSQTFLAVDSSATQILVSGASNSGLDLQPNASSSPGLVSWDQTFSNCAPAAKIWNGQRFVMIGSQNGFDEFYLPLNYYFSSNTTCHEPSGTGPTMGWASSTFLQ